MSPDAINSESTAPPPIRVRVALRGAVQGVGFRPFVHRLATELHLTGWVNNSPQGVFLEVEGERPTLDLFLQRLQSHKPTLSFIQSTEITWLDALGQRTFEILASDTSGQKVALVLPDIATCPDCLRELFDTQNRRYLYPFTNCTHCGPRFTIIESLPYDRANTSMKRFTMCPACQAEYDHPQDRRFHAQPNACPICGPQLAYWMAGDQNENPHPLLTRHEALLAAATAIRAGKIVAVKGIGGFHLMVDARNEAAVQRLRERKHREEKPFAILFPSLESAAQACEISPFEARLLDSPEAPIVLLRQLTHRPPALANKVAPGNPNLGIMLPSNPLHHLLMAELGFPVVATSGNLSDEPICTDEHEALDRLRGIADAWLVHDRPIMRHVDDSIVRVVLDREMVLRRARGYAPLPISVAFSAEKGWETRQTQPQPLSTVLAVGAHLKNAVALAVDQNVFVSQHIGDLETTQAEAAFRRVSVDLQRLYESPAQIVVADLHPDYLSTRFAREHSSAQVVQVQHHIAHALSCLAENEVKLPTLAVAWDGTGYGTDGTIWGGEFFLVKPDSVLRVASLRPFRLPGGETAVKEPRRAALGLLFELFGDAVFQRVDLAPVAAFSTSERSLLKTMLERGLNSPVTSSMGRLFDAVASLIHLRHQMRFEGQAAMELEWAANGIATEAHYELPPLPNHAGLDRLDWALMVHRILADLQPGLAIGEISAKFHNTLVEWILTVARRQGIARVALSGGCFQNRYLLERAVNRLRAEGFHPYWHQRVPPNDGGIALGQVMAARGVGGSLTIINQPS